MVEEKRTPQFTRSTAQEIGGTLIAFALFVIAGILSRGGQWVPLGYILALIGSFVLVVIVIIPVIIGEGDEAITKPSLINYKDYVVFFLLLLPLILVVGFGEGDVALLFVLFASPPSIYLDSRRLGESRKSAVFWAIGSFLLWIVITPIYIFSRRKWLKKRLQQE